MKHAMHIFINILHYISLFGIIISGIIGVIGEIAGPSVIERILQRIGVSNGYNRVWTVSAILLIVLIATHFMKVKIFGD